MNIKKAAYDIVVPIIYDGETVGYRYYSVGTGLLGADQFIGYKFIKKESS